MPAPLPPRALVTGASSGLGAAFATALARRSYALILVARSRDRLEALATELQQRYGVPVEVCVADLCQPEALHRVEDLIGKEAALTLLVNNAGFGTIGPFAELDPQREEEEIRLNIIALCRLTRAALPGMLARGQGYVLNVSSLSALLPGAYDATYGATKAFVNSFTEALHEELRGTGVHVQALCPGFTHTEFQQRAGLRTDAIPRWVWMRAEEVVEISLHAMQRHQVVCIPGLLYQILAACITLLPRRLVSRIAARLSRQVQGH